MTGFVVLYGGMALIAATIVMLDYFGRRQQRKARATRSQCCSSPHTDDFWP